MKDKTYYLMYRDWMDNNAFIQSKYSQREAWIWLIENAIFKDEYVAQSRVNHKDIQLKRGEFSHSRSYMAKAWGWSEGRVTRFIEKLKNRKMIDIKTEQGQWVVSICNYNKYQVRRTEGETETSTEGDTETERNKNQCLLMNINDKPPISPLKHFDEFWQHFPRQRRGSKKNAIQKYKIAIKEKRATEEDILNGVQRYAASHEVSEGYATSAERWLHNDKWSNDYKYTANAQSNQQRSTKLDTAKQQLMDWMDEG